MLVYVLLIYLLILFGIIFPIFYLYISKASYCFTSYRLKGKNGVGCLRTPYRLKNFAHKSIVLDM
jgi:hypothetical protein